MRYLLLFLLPLALLAQPGGVQQIRAGSGVTVSSPTGIVTISATGGTGNVTAAGTLAADAIMLGDGLKTSKTTTTGANVVTALGIAIGSLGGVQLNNGSGAGLTAVNAATLGGATFAAPGAIGGGTPGAATFTSVTVAGGGAAGVFTSVEGTAPALTANAFQIYAPADVAAGGLAYITPGAAASGIMRATNSSGVMTISHTELSGDITTSGSNAATLATVNGNVGTFGSATAASVVTINAKGQVTAGSNATITPSAASITAGTLTADITLGENFGLVYDPALSADGKYSGTVRAGIAGATLAFGDLVYLAAADSRWELTDADSATTSGNVLIGFCVLAAAADGDPTTILLQGFINAAAKFPAMTVSGPMYIDTATAGAIRTTAPSTTGQIVRRVGFAWSQDELYFSPSMDSGTAP